MGKFKIKYIIEYINSMTESLLSLQAAEMARRRTFAIISHPDNRLSNK